MLPFYSHKSKPLLLFFSGRAVRLLPAGGSKRQKEAMERSESEKT